MDHYGASGPGRPVKDGIVTTMARPRSAVGVRWGELYAKLGPAHQAKLTRGRTLARGGRVRDLSVSPGLVTSEVSDKDPQRPSLRIRTFGDKEWARLVAVLASDLALAAAFLEGIVGDRLLDKLDAEKVALVPTRKDVEGDCDCVDFNLPCAHIAALHAVIGEALEGEPLLLFTVRGRPHEEVVQALRRAWGDERSADHHAKAGPSGELSPGDWLRSPMSTGRIAFNPPLVAPAVPAGLIALGPFDGENLLPVLGPLYEAGAAAARAIALREGPARVRHKGTGGPEGDHSEIEGLGEGPGRSSGGLAREGSAGDAAGGPVHEVAVSGAAIGQGTDVTGRIVELLAATQPARTVDLAKVLGMTAEQVRDELIALEGLGIVYRTGQTRGTRWWLG